MKRINAAKNKYLKYINQCLRPENSTQFLFFNLAESFLLPPLFTAEGLQYLNSGLKSLKYVKTIIVNFWQNRIQDQGIKMFSKSIKYLNHVQTILFDFSFCQISDQGLISIAKAMKSFHKLQSLSLSFYKQINQLY